MGNNIETSNTQYYDEVYNHLRRFIRLGSTYKNLYNVDEVDHFFIKHVIEHEEGISMKYHIYRHLFIERIGYQKTAELNSISKNMTKLFMNDYNQKFHRKGKWL